ncbi:MAG: hypothetical protein V4672_10775 [Verrucomicrobiota bacterium]
MRKILFSPQDYLCNYLLGCGVSAAVFMSWGEAVGMIAWVFLVYLGVWLLPVWLPVLMGVLMPGLRTGPRAVLVLSGLLTGLHASRRRVDGVAGDLSSLVSGHVSTLVLSACMILSGFCLIIVHSHVRDRKTCTPAGILGLVFLSATVPVWWWLLGL